MYGKIHVYINVYVRLYLRKRSEEDHHLFVRFALSPLALSCFLDVFGRQPSDSGRVLMVAPELADLMLAVKLPPQMPFQTVVVETLMSNETSVTPKANMITFNLQTTAKMCALSIVIK